MDVSSMTVKLSVDTSAVVAHVEKLRKDLEAVQNAHALWVKSLLESVDKVNNLQMKACVNQEGR